MKKHILAVYDLEEVYARNFALHIGQKRSIPFEVQAFTNEKKLIEAARKEQIEILLISDQAITAQIQMLEIGQIIILSGGISNQAFEQYPKIYKYQSSDTVIREVMACYGENLTQSASPAMKKPMEIRGIYSPLGRVQKTSFALAMGQILAKEQAVLYLNLEEYAGFEGIFQTTYETGLSDLIYYLKQRQMNLAHRVAGMVQSVNGLDYIPPAISGADIRETSFEEWKFLLQELTVNSTYETLLIDFGDGVDELFGMLDLCQYLYMPICEDPVAAAKISQFEALLRMSDEISVLEKIKKVKLPESRLPGVGGQYAEQLAWSPLGDYIRALIRGEKQ